MTPTQGVTYHFSNACYFCLILPKNRQFRCLFPGRNRQLFSKFWKFFACFFSPGCHEIRIMCIFFNPICERNPAIPLCRTGVGWTPPFSGRFAVSDDNNEHFFEKTDKKSAPSDISEKPKNRQKMLITGIEKSVCHTLGTCGSS